MENEVRVDLIEFLSCISFQGKTQKDETARQLVKDMVEHDEIGRLFSSVVKNYSKEKKNAEEQLFVKASSVKNKLNGESKVKILVLLINHFISISGGLKCDQEEVVRKVAMLLDVNEQDVNSIVEFYISDEPFADKQSAAYFINTDTPWSYKHIGVNVHKYNEPYITYVKYLPKYEVILTKRFKAVDKEYSLFEQFVTEKISVYGKESFNWAEFSCIEFDELIAKVETFCPYTFYEIEQTENSPKIVLDPESNKVIISGSSSPLSLTNFFNPVLDWITCYKEHGKGKLKIYIILDYFNTYTSKFLTRLNKECDNINQKGLKAQVFFFLDPEDDDMREFGEHMQRINKKGFEFCFINESYEMIHE